MSRRTQTTRAWVWVSCGWKSHAIYHDCCKHRAAGTPNDVSMPWRQYFKHLGFFLKTPMYCMRTWDSILLLPVQHECHWRVDASKTRARQQSAIAPAIRTWCDTSHRLNYRQEQLYNYARLHASFVCYMEGWTRTRCRSGRLSIMFFCCAWLVIGAWISN